MDILSIFIGGGDDMVEYDRESARPDPDPATGEQESDSLDSMNGIELMDLARKLGIDTKPLRAAASRKLGAESGIIPWLKNSMDPELVARKEQEMRDDANAGIRRAIEDLKQQIRSERYDES